MPAAIKYPWIEMRRNLSAVQVDHMLDDMKGYRSYASQKHHRCQICPVNTNNHKMWYRLMLCNSVTCNENCEWSLKILTCLDEFDSPTPPTSTTRNVSFVYQCGEHVNPVRSPPRKKMKLAVKRFVKERTTLGARPSRVQGDIADTFRNLDVSRLPTLPQIQRVAYHFRRTKLLQDAVVKHMNQLIEQNLSSDGLGSNVPIAFGHDVDECGRANVGRGTDEEPTLVGITTRNLLSRLRLASERLLHVDATFKLNESGYPVIVFGISDRARTFYPIAFFITSQLQAVHYKRALERLFEQYELYFGEPPKISDVMTDADDALYNALDSICEGQRYQRPRHMMCFFHVMMNVKKHTKHLTKPQRRQVKDLIYNMHFSRDEAEFQAHCQEAVSGWSTTNELKIFLCYFKKQWIESRFNRWQSFWSRPGEAKTNNPIEQFNRVIKRDYTLGALVPINTMFEQLLKMARAKSTYQGDVVSHNIPVSSVMARYRYLAKANLLQVQVPQRHSLTYLLHGNASEVKVLQTGIIDRNVPRPAKKRGVDKFFSTKHNKRQNGFEMRDQPSAGWTVNIELNECGCKSMFKFGFCVHVVAALVAMGLKIPGQKTDAVFFNRRIHRGDSSAQRTTGRPRSVGPALSLV